VQVRVAMAPAELELTGDQRIDVRVDDADGQRVLRALQ
jgi:hypothetical protein